MRTLTFFYNGYVNSFRGLSREVWWLALITLINRAGAMVVPFLSLYLTENQGFSIAQVGWIMSSFGMGALTGSWLGGKLVLRIGHYKVMYLSLIGTSIAFILFQFLQGFWWITLGIFILFTISDTFRPAVFVAMSAYSKPENKTRSVTLIRLAINLGFSVGPAIGGLLIAHIGYNSIFWVDGITCLIAGVLLLRLLDPRKAKEIDPEVPTDSKASVWKDTNYIIFLGAVILISVGFMQYFSTIPQFYKRVSFLDEDTIGLLFGLNGLLIFLFEMPLVKFLEQKSTPILDLIILGLSLMALSIFILNVSPALPNLILGMTLMTVGEMIAFPFSNAFALLSARKGRMGDYMGYYTVAFSVGMVVGHNFGLQLVEAIGFKNSWYLLGLVPLGSIILLGWIRFRNNPFPTHTSPEPFN